MRSLVRLSALLAVALGPNACLRDRPSGPSQSDLSPPDVDRSVAVAPAPTLVACPALPELGLPHVTVDEARLVPAGPAGAERSFC